MGRGKQGGEPPKSRRPPATTVEGRENQLISLAVDLAEEQLRSGSASAQVITHYLKLATVREQLERDNLRADIELKAGRTEALGSSKRIEELYNNAIVAFRQYHGEIEEPYED